MITADGEKIRGRRLTELLKTLAADRTLLRLRIRRFGYERLTIIKGFRRDSSFAYLILDYPDGLRETLGEVREWENELEFTGPDGLLYACGPAKGRFYLGDIWIRIPESIWRLQRRKSFRLEAPMGTMLRWPGVEEGRELEVIDISLGGALCAAAHGPHLPRRPSPGRRLYGIAIEFPSETEKLTVNVRKAKVVRLAEDPRPGRFRMALQFIDMEKTEEKTLKDLIYRFQRKYLRTRLNL